MSEGGERTSSFGEYFKRERSLRGISKKEIVQVTRVRERYLDALEANRFNDLPPKTFVVGFLKSAAKHIGLDEAEVVNRYLQELSEQEQTLEQRGGPKKINLATPWKFGLGLIVALLVFVLLMLPWLLRI